MYHLVRYRLPALLWAVVIFIASSIPGSKIPRFIHQINDKLIHASIFFVFGLFVYLALEPKVKSVRLDWKRVVIAVLVVVVYGISDELHQSFVPGRTVDVLDATADSLGGLLAAAAVVIRHQFRRDHT